MSKPMTEEQYCLQCIAELRESFQRDAKPYFDRLAAIRAMNPQPSIMLSLDQAREFIGFTMSADPAAPAEKVQP